MKDKNNIQKEIEKEYIQGKEYYNNVEEKQKEDKNKRHIN